MKRFGILTRAACWFSGSMMLYGIPAADVMAQTRNKGSTPTECISLPSPSDSIPMAVVVQVLASGKTRAIPDEFASRIAEQLQSHLVLSDQFAFTVLQPFGTMDTHAIPHIGAHAYITLRPKGPPDDIVFGTGTMNKEFHTALLSAIIALRADSLLPFPDKAKKIELELRIFTERNQPETRNVLFRTTLPIYTVDGWPILMKNDADLTYPKIALAAKKTDSVTVALVVGPDGRPIQSTIDPVRGTYRDFMEEVIRVLPRMRYKPMQVGGCSVRAQINQGFYFTIR